MYTFVPVFVEMGFEGVSLSLSSILIMTSLGTLKLVYAAFFNFITYRNYW